LGTVFSELHFEAPDRVVEVELITLETGSMDPIHQASSSGSVGVEWLVEVDFLLTGALAE